MKTLVTICVVVIVLLGTTNIVSADVATVTFNGSDIMAPASTTVNTTGTPVVGDGYIDPGGNVIRTYNTYDSSGNLVTTGNPTTFNAWLSAGNGITQFNLWLQDGASNQAAMWGETLSLTDPKTPAANITPFASTGWTASVYTITDADGWGTSWDGSKLITYTADAGVSLTQGTTATFGFTADVVGINGATGPDYQIWVGAGNPGGITDTTASLFQRAITASVPEPCTMALLGLGGLLFARKKK